MSFCSHSFRSATARLAWQSRFRDSSNRRDAEYAEIRGDTLCISARSAVRSALAQEKGYRRPKQNAIAVARVAITQALCQNTAMQAPPQQPTLLESTLRRDRYIVLAGLAAITLLAWAYLFYVAPGMSGMDSVGKWGEMAASGMGVGFGPVAIILMFLMWAVMMVAMMAPTAAPMILAFANINRRRRELGNPYVPTAVFLSGYLLVWAGFSVAATAAQVALIFAIMGSATITGSIIGGILLLMAGAFQLSPLKSVCLRHCRTPMGFITNEWREERRGALLMGLHHGGYCLGCCWALMGLLFLLGVMNLLWIAALAAFVLVEKVVPAGVWVGRLAGVGLLAWGIWLLAGAFL